MNDPITLQEMPGIRARTYQDLVRYLIDRAGTGIAPAGMSLSDVLANAGDVAGFGHRANMGLVNTGTEDRPLWIPRPGAEFDPSGSAFVRAPATPTMEERIATMGKMRDANARNMGISRRNFMKAVPGGALAAKALLSGGETGIKNQTSKILNEVAAQGTATAAPPLGAAPVRLYERVGNKFILIKEAHPGDYGRDAAHLGDWPLPSEINRTVHGVYNPADWKKVEAETGVRPKQAIRPVELEVEHPEYKLLAGPNSVVDRYVAPKGADPESLAARATGSDPYHARYARSKDLVNQRLEGLTKSFVKQGIPPNMTPEQIEAWQGLYGKHPNEGGVVEGMNVGPHVPNTYIVEKPIRVRYYEEAARFPFRSSLMEPKTHPEVFKLPIEYNGQLDHFNLDGPGPGTIDRGYSPWESAPRLIGSGDDYSEAISKANNFLRDIGVDPANIKWTGNKIKRATLPNGDMIEIRERPSLGLGYKKRGKR